MLTLRQISELKAGDRLYSSSFRGSDGLPSRVKVTSVKRWKTRPNDFVVRWKYGLYVYSEITVKDGNIFDMNDFCLTEEEAIEEASRKKGVRTL